MLAKYYKRNGLSKKLNYISTDTTFIMNKNGKEQIGLNKYYHKKKGNKISLIIDTNKKIVNMKIYKGCKNDTKILEDQLKENMIINDIKNDLKNDLKNDKYKKYFMADAGYDSKNIHKILRNLNYIPLIDQNKRGIKNENLIRRMTNREYKIYCKRGRKTTCSFATLRGR
jgi:hypothetical protein